MLSVWIRMPTESITVRCSDIPLSPCPPSALPRTFFLAQAAIPALFGMSGDSLKADRQQLRFCCSARARRSDPCQQGTSICATPAAPRHRFNFAPCPVGKCLHKITSGTSHPPTPHHSAHGWRRTLISSASFPEVRHHRRNTRETGAGFCKMMHPGQHVNKYTLEDEVSGGACCSGAQANRKHVMVSWKGALVLCFSRAPPLCFPSTLLHHPSASQQQLGQEGDFGFPSLTFSLPSLNLTWSLAVTSENKHKMKQTNQQTKIPPQKKQASKQTTKKSNPPCIGLP